MPSVQPPRAVSFLLPCQIMAVFPILDALNVCSSILGALNPLNQIRILKTFFVHYVMCDLRKRKVSPSSSRAYLLDSLFFSHFLVVSTVFVSM